MNEKIKDKLRRGLALTVKESWDLYQYIKTLEQQPCEDAISRAYVESIVEELENICINGDEHILSLLSNIKNAPPVTPQHTRWIPVSERLPEGGQDVLFCDIDGDIMIGYHVRGRLDTRFSQQGTYEDIKNVRAWMPLPESYKVESEENNDDD